MAADLPRPPWWLFRMRRLFRARTLPLDGLRLSGYGSGMPKGMAHQIARGDYEAPERAASRPFSAPATGSSTLAPASASCR